MKRKPNGQFAKGSHWRPHKRFRERAYLSAEYAEKTRSASEIAQEWGVTENAILYWLGKHDIPRRSMAEARGVKKWGVSGEANGMYGVTGSANPNYIDGSSPERQRAYARCFWKAIAAKVRHRDGYRCRRCQQPKSKGNPLHAHHVKPWAGNPESRFDVANIIMLCKSCHCWVHSNANTAGDFIQP